eukprot:8719603-Ditylum_brightwellii.AAC.1
MIWHLSKMTLCHLDGRLVYLMQQNWQLILNYKNITPACKTKIHIDNKGIVTQVRNQIKYTYDYPYNTLEPDWDAIAQSADHLHMLGTKRTIEHVKSHQDANCDYDQLDLPAQLYVSADNLAISYREDTSEILLDILRLPINDAQLIHDSGIINGYYFKKIRDITTEKDLASHAMETNKWMTERFSWVDWPTFQRC